MFIHNAGYGSPELPFGAVNNCGNGRELSAAGIEEVVNKTGIRVA